MFRRVGCFILLACGLASAQQSTPVLANPDPFTCFTMSAPNSSYATLQTVNVAGQPFTRAFHITTLRLSTNAWDTRSRCFSTLAAQQNDTIVARFWMRTVSPPGGTGYTTFVVEKGADPWTKSISYTADAGSDWKFVEIPFKMAETYGNGGPSGGANTYNISFWVNFGPQEIEIGGLTIDNYGQNVSLWDLGLRNWPYEGWAPDAPWRQAAAERIEKYRKGDIAVVVRDAQGNPIPNAPVHVKMKRHAFGWGSAIDGGRLVDDLTGDGDKYREYVLKMFNKAVLENNLKWPFWDTRNQAACGEGWGRPPTDRALDWLRQHGITDLRGHNLIWPGKGNLPCDVVNLLNAQPVDQLALRNRINSHFSEILSATQGKLTEWDVLNEPFSNKDVQAVLGDAEMAEWFKSARTQAPGVKLYINDYNILEAGGRDFQHQDGFYAITQGVLDNGGPVDGIGLQSHFDNNFTPPERLLQILDRFAQLSPDLEVTEFDIDNSDTRLQHDYTRDFMTVLFSHPSVTSFIIWGFWENQIWHKNCAMVRADWTHKPNYDVWMDLTQNQWWTDVQGTTDADGVYRTRGFLGDYDIDVTAGGQTATTPLTVAKGVPNYLLRGQQTAGGIDAVVNAASFVRGAVAPGEIVEFWGTNYGSKTPAFGVYDGMQLAKYGGDTRVLFDGVPAPLVHTMRWASDPNVGRAAVVVPYSVAGRSQTQVEIEYLGTKTPAFTVPVANAAPGIFTYGGGTGQAIAVNHHGQTLSLNQDQAVSRGDYLEFYITGEGQTNPAGVDGLRRVYPNNPAPVQNVVVKIGGVESKKTDPGCEYNWVGQIWAGVTQINVCVPPGTPTGDAVPLEVSVGGTPAQMGVTVRVQ